MFPRDSRSPKTYALLVAALLVPFVACTPGEPASESAEEAPPPMQQGLQPLEDRADAAPKVGDLFPDVTIVSDDGQPVNVRKLAGEKPYTVLTLGCLT